jgi:hypothetical protein
MTIKAYMTIVDGKIVYEAVIAIPSGPNPCTGR